jgi:hypothetical protein
MWATFTLVFRAGSGMPGIPALRPGKTRPRRHYNIDQVKNNQAFTLDSGTGRPGAGRKKPERLLAPGS